MDNECCAKCKYYHRLKNNFKVGEGFEESHCCDVLLHLPKDESEGWVQEVTPQDRCEMYKEKDHIADADKMIEPTTKNNLVDGKDNNVTSTDCISRQEAIDTIRQLYLDLATQKYVIDLLKVLPSVAPQESKEITLEDVKGYCKPRCLTIITNEQLYELTHPKIKAPEQEPRKGEWLRMSDLSEQEDDRYKCSRCGNVIHHKSKMYLYTFNSWCGRCGCDNDWRKCIEGN